MGKFAIDAQELLKQVGGRENIQSVTHCVTRMRFVLADVNKANIENIKAISSAKGTFIQSGQFQVIIGNEVQAFYNEFVEIACMKQTEINEETTKSQTWLQSLMGSLGEIFAPLIPALICGGLVLGIRNCLADIYFLENGTKSITDLYPFWAEMAIFLELTGNTIFHFLPAGIVWSITKKMGTTQILGIVLGLTMVSSQNSVVQVAAAILAGFTLVYLEKFWRKISWESVSILIVPLFSLVPAVLITQLIAMPLGQMIDSFFATVVYRGFTSSYGWLLGALTGAFYAPLVITGLHHITNVLDLQLIYRFQGTVLWPLLALSNIAQGSAVLAMSVLQRKDANLKKANVSAYVSCYLGVTEPAMFGVNLKYRFPFICAMIGSATASAYGAFNKVTAISIGVGGLPGILSIQAASAVHFVIAVLIAVLITFILTICVGKKALTKETADNQSDSNVKEENFLCPLSGRVIPLAEVEDQVFSAGLMGEGFAIELTEGDVLAPFSGEIVMTFPTKHAYGIKREDGLEVLIHLGMDTVELNGEGFECFVNPGDIIKQGEIIARVDIDSVKAHGKSLVSPVVITSHQHVVLKNVKMIKGQEPIIEIHEE